MEANLFLKSLESKGIELVLTDEGEIEFTALDGVMTDEVREQIRARKGDIVSLLAPTKRREKMATWPAFLQAAYAKTVDFRRREGDTAAKAEEKAFLVYKRPAAMFAALDQGEPLANALGRLRGRAAS